jgi:tRNA U55 pseudouridine synthase TruB
MDISRVRGDFRQTEILELWKEYLLGSSPPLLNLGEGSGVRLGHFSAHVSSGTYIRSLVNDIGKTLGCGATTLSIKRTRVGDYKIEDSLKF